MENVVAPVTVTAPLPIVTAPVDVLNVPVLPLKSFDVEPVAVSPDCTCGVSRPTDDPAPAPPI